MFNNFFAIENKTYHNVEKRSWKMRIQAKSFIYDFILFFRKRNFELSLNFVP